jgi:hypothetical protein
VPLYDNRATELMKQLETANDAEVDATKALLAYVLTPIITTAPCFRGPADDRQKYANKRAEM